MLKNTLFGALEAGAVTSLALNLVLDAEFGPKFPGGCATYGSIALVLYNPGTASRRYRVLMNQHELLAYTLGAAALQSVRSEPIQQ